MAVARRLIESRCAPSCSPRPRPRAPRPRVPRTTRPGSGASASGSQAALVPRSARCAIITATATLAIARLLLVLGALVGIISGKDP